MENLILWFLPKRIQTEQLFPIYLDHRLLLGSPKTPPISFKLYFFPHLISRWMHAICQNLNTEEEVENIADMGFDCTICRPYIPPTNGKETIETNGRIAHCNKLIALGMCSVL